MAAKNVIIRKMVSQELIDLMPKTVFAQVFDGTGKSLEQFATDIASKMDDKADLTAFTQLKTSFDNLVQGADVAYDTLKEIGEYISTHQDEYQALVTIAAGKVDKVEGKGLSTNDFTNALKTKVEELYDKATLDGKFSTLDGKVTANTTAINTLNGAVTVEGSVKKTVKDAIDALNITALESRVGQTETNITSVKADITAINNASTGILAQAKSYADGKDAETLQAAKTYADGVVSAKSSKIYFQKDQPAGLTENDIWFQDLTTV